MTREDLEKVARAICAADKKVDGRCRTCPLEDTACRGPGAPSDRQWPGLSPEAALRFAAALGVTVTDEPCALPFKLPIDARGDEA